MTIISIEKFISDFSKKLMKRDVAIFAGAGLSVAAGFADWKKLLAPLIDELKLSAEKEHDLVKVAQFHVNHHGSNRNDLTDIILNSFSRRQTKITESHKILARLPISTYWTTNYDTCIENALREVGKIPDVKHEVTQLLQTVHGRDAIVYKMHGDVDHAHDAVLCKEDYEKFHIDRGDFLTALAGDLLSKTFLFIGFSFNDPNLDYVLSRLYSKHTNNLRKHYCFVRKEAAMEGDKPGDLEYRIAKQHFFIRDLERYNIRAVEVTNYDEIPLILKRIEQRFKSHTVFISGAAHVYGDKISEEEALTFVHKLSSKLIEKRFRIVTGLGLGIGSTVINGALEQIYQVERRVLHDDLVIRPFPQGTDMAKIWPQYRSDMLDYAGLSIYLFGNKIVEATGEVVESNGMINEFDIAEGKGVKVLPLGFTGFAAKTLWIKVNDNFDSYYPAASDEFKKAFSELGDDTRSFEEHLNSTILALDELQKL